MDVDPVDDDPDELTPLPGHMNGEGSRLSLFQQLMHI